MSQISEINEIGNHVTHILTQADLIQLGGIAAVEYCGGPSMTFRMGRRDVESEGDAVHHDKESYGTSLQVEGLNKANLQPEEYVALMGMHTLGFVG
jgi:catalase (peroxidase I)